MASRKEKRNNRTPQPFDERIGDIHAAWKRYWADRWPIVKRRLEHDPNLRLLAPSVVIHAQTPHHLITEFAGAALEYKGFKTKRLHSASADEYLYQFTINGLHEAAHLPIDDDGIVLHNIVVARGVDYGVVRERFPFLPEFRGDGLAFLGDGGPLVRFTPRAGLFAMNHTSLLNTNGVIHRVKSTKFLTVMPRRWSIRKMMARLDRAFAEGDASNTFLGLTQVYNPQAEGPAIAASFSNLFLMSNLHETAISAFVAQYPMFLLRALQYRSQVIGPRLRWIDGQPTNDDVLIVPDVMLQRHDGYFDILDFKTALLLNASLTKKERRRRQFTSSVNDGLAQLAHYREYFDSHKNAAYALERYGIRCKDPKLILVIGYADNVSSELVTEALRAFSPDMLVIDYDTLNSLFIRASARG